MDEELMQDFQGLDPLSSATATGYSLPRQQACIKSASAPKSPVQAGQQSYTTAQAPTREST